MRIDAISIALLNIGREHARDFNRWYDLDHLPEHVSKQDVLSGNRYVATGPTRRSTGVVAGDITNGHPPYATIYGFGGPLDLRDQAALDGWRDLDRSIVKAGRFWLEGSVSHGSSWRPAETYTTGSVQVRDDAVSHLPHRTLVMSIGACTDEERAADWWRATQYDSILDIDGVLAVQRMTPVDDPHEGLMLHLILSEQDPVTTMSRLADVRSYQTRTGRFPCHGGHYELLSMLPYERIVPFQYDFIGVLDPD